MLGTGSLYRCSCQVHDELLLGEEHLLPAVGQATAETGWPGRAPCDSVLPVDTVHSHRTGKPIELTQLFCVPTYTTFLDSDYGLSPTCPCAIVVSQSSNRQEPGNGASFDSMTGQNWRQCRQRLILTFIFVKIFFIVRMRHAHGIQNCRCAFQHNMHLLDACITTNDIVSFRTISGSSDGDVCLSIWSPTLAPWKTF